MFLLVDLVCFSGHVQITEEKKSEALEDELANLKLRISQLETSCSFGRISPEPSYISGTIARSFRMSVTPGVNWAIF